VVNNLDMGERKMPVLDPGATARKVAAMALGRAAAHRERLAAQTALLERLADMPLEELSRHVNGRQWMAAVFAASGSTEPEIARALGLRGGAVSAHRLLKHPVVVRLVELIRGHQLALVLRGEFGVQSQARAAAPAIMQNLTELAGAAAPDTEGKRAGRARRDADSIRAGELVLDVGGYRVHRHQHEHVHQVLFDQMTDAELEHLAEQGSWPERFQGALGGVAPFTDCPSLPAPAVNEAASRAERRPRNGRRAGR
jgi:hypothetical protein